MKNFLWAVAGLIVLVAFARSCTGNNQNNHVDPIQHEVNTTTQPPAVTLNLAGLLGKPLTEADKLLGIRLYEYENTSGLPGGGCHYFLENNTVLIDILFSGSKVVDGWNISLAEQASGPIYSALNSTDRWRSVLNRFGFSNYNIVEKRSGTSVDFIFQLDNKDPELQHGFDAINDYRGTVHIGRGETVYLITIRNERY